MEIPLIVNDFLRRAAMLYPDKTAIVDGALRFSYRDYQRRANQLSNALISLGVTKGDRVCILSPNSHFFLESFYGVGQIGAILVPLNYRLLAADHVYILNHSGVETVLVDAEYCGVVDAIRQKLPRVKNWIVACDGASPTRGDDPWRNWNTLIDGASGESPPDAQLEESDIVSINYTSGTTARPKGVMLSHRNFYLNAYNLIAHLGVSHDDVELWTLPMFHCNGWGSVYALTGMAGTHVVLRSVEAPEIYRLLEQEAVTFACMAPAVLRTIIDFPDRDRYAIKTRPRFAVAGAPPPAAFIEKLESQLGFEFIQLYGLTETAPLLTISRPDYATRRDDWPRRARAGVPGLGVELEVRDEADKPVPKDGETIGEICARSNVVFDGYWDQPDQTSEAIRDGWFHTGDLAVWDESNSLHIVDRKKDVIISGGENISSPEVEDVLYHHPDVLECAVIGVPDEKWGETPKALVVMRPGSSPLAGDLIDFCRERLAHFKCPTSVEFVEDLPRTVTGKLQKFKLRERYWNRPGGRRIN